MSWYDGTLTAAAGQLKAILDAKLPLNAFWHIEDAGAGANVGVYHCYDPDNNVDFVVAVLDNQADYASIQLWAGWDSGAHAGTGENWASATEYTINKNDGGYGLSVLDHRFIYVNKEATKSSYVGQLSRFDVALNMPIMIVGDLTASYNPLGVIAATYTYWLCLADENGVKRTLLYHGAISGTGATFYVRTTDSRYIIRETVVVNLTSLKAMGFLEGAMTLGAASASGLANGDIVTDDDANEWLAVIPASVNKGCSLIRKS